MFQLKEFMRFQSRAASWYDLRADSYASSASLNSSFNWKNSSASTSGSSSLVHAAFALSVSSRRLPTISRHCFGCVLTSREGAVSPSVTSPSVISDKSSSAS
eukprot:CAMPEP_0197716520 /NCGR_PEP_ID=MMETSP1434-20131217/1387_1 /TAXON_ID=265543 /ORGANISM="Minutocellus polymorphus, Strain CCMP3303" /LENGTH=101 /DNA_ID=CAMNT_0043300895 /DNA_START=174 /DNA_END=479 /DNA_ORIENTATION=-